MDFLRRLISILKFEFECELVTPLIMYGANKKKLQLRSSSIKGLLRYWWRTFQGSKKNEEKYFGGINQISPFKIYLIDLKTNEKKMSIKYKNYNKHMVFLLRNQKSYLGKFKFGIEFNQRRNNEKENLIEFFRALKLLMLFGGLGNRSRKTCGNFIINEINILMDTKNIVQKKDNIIEIDKKEIIRTGYYTYKEVKSIFNEEMKFDKNDSEGTNRVELLISSEKNSRVEFDFRNLKKFSEYVDMIEYLKSKVYYKSSNNSFENKKNVVNLMKLKLGYKAYVVKINEEI